MTRKQTKGESKDAWSEREDKADIRKLCEQPSRDKDTQTNNGDSRQAS